MLLRTGCVSIDRDESAIRLLYSNGTTQNLKRDDEPFLLTGIDYVSLQAPQRTGRNSCMSFRHVGPRAGRGRDCTCASHSQFPPQGPAQEFGHFQQLRTLRHAKNRRRVDHSQRQKTYPGNSGKSKCLLLLCCRRYVRQKCFVPFAAQQHRNHFFVLRLYIGRKPGEAFSSFHIEDVRIFTSP